MRQAYESIILELECAVTRGSPERRVETLRRVTDLFLRDAERLSEEQVEIFDELLCILIVCVESCARAELSERLAPIDYAPFQVIQYLALDIEVAVAGSVLTSSSRLATSTLIEAATTKGHDHRLAIAGRLNLPEIVTDVIVGRGEKDVVRTLATNASARFSEMGYSGMVALAEADDELAESLALRIDLPPKFLRDLLWHATDVVRERLLAVAPPELQKEIKVVLATISSLARESEFPLRDFSRAEQLVRLLKDLNELDEATVIKFAEANKFDETAASLAILSGLSTDMIARVMEGLRSDLLLIPCKSAGLGWAAVEAIIRNRPLSQPISEQTLKLVRQDYGRLSARTARRTVRFWLVHNKVEK